MRGIGGDGRGPHHEHSALGMVGLAVLLFTGSGVALAAVAGLMVGAIEAVRWAFG